LALVACNATYFERSGASLSDFGLGSDGRGVGEGGGGGRGDGAESGRLLLEETRLARGDVHGRLLRRNGIYRRGVK